MHAPPESSDPLAQRRIAVAESRELDLFASLLARRGAQVLRYPLVQIIDAPDPRPVLDWLTDFAAGGCDDLILLTGEGLRRLLHCIDAHEPALRAPFLSALARVRKITRGPKPARALRELGLQSDLPAELPTTPGVIAVLRPFSLGGRRVGVQLYGADANQPLIEFLTAAGAHVASVAPYRYADGAPDSAVQELLAGLRTGSIDAIAFTSKSQVERLFRSGGAELVRACLAATAVAAVGPVVADTLRAHGVDVGAMPPSSWHLKPLTAALAELFAAAQP
jgi:uroporphyrinogen-III synthase